MECLEDPVDEVVTEVPQCLRVVVPTRPLEEHPKGLVPHQRVPVQAHQESVVEQTSSSTPDLPPLTTSVDSRTGRSRRGWGRKRGGLYGGVLEGPWT